ncbi:hypothetical protein CYY_009437 [Polysphondylium violaceum]|uniref:Cytidyltransferase-like domain-containing protein n=1 Tax=Polysphondylium violaceum TaxID=133409 RepID=A0A8J4PLU1_9MYCE|nr:hypothetical protein CYY_009437 [Polysphondylium violaceum]
MYKSGLIRLLFNFESKNSLAIHYYNIGKLISVVPQVKDQLFVELINYNSNNNNFNNSSTTKSADDNIENFLVQGSKYEHINSLFQSTVARDLNSVVPKNEFQDEKSPSTIVNNHFDTLKYFENVFFNYYQMLYNKNPKLDVTIIPVNLINEKVPHDKQDHLKRTTPHKIDALFVDHNEYTFSDITSINETRSLEKQPLVDSVVVLEDKSFAYPSSIYSSYLEQKRNGTFSQMKKWTPPFKGVVLGGTFDRMHPGHKVMLTMATLLCSNYMEVGVTDNSILKSKKFNEMIAPYQERSDKTFTFIKSINPFVEYNMLQLFEPYANTMTSPKLECIVISPETFGTAIKINEKRRENPNLKPLEIYSISYFDSHHQGSDFKLSSSYLRELDYNEMMEKKKNNQN